MADSLEDKVKAAYRRNFEGTHNWADAWNKTLEEISGSYDPDASEERHQLREQVGQILRKVHHDIEADAGDPYALAVAAAVRDLKNEGVAEIMRQRFLETEREFRETMIKHKRLNIPKGPKEWTPRKEKREEEVERLVDRERESNPNDLTLYILFDDQGAFEGWNMDHPSYWGGHSGPVAYVTVSADLDYEEIRKAIGETLGELDWKKISEQLEGEDA